MEMLQKKHYRCGRRSLHQILEIQALSILIRLNRFLLRLTKSS
nr:MAG TPA: hypothetical protein [Caudoviricetes sp.]